MFVKKPWYSQSLSSPPQLILYMELVLQGASLGSPLRTAEFHPLSLSLFPQTSGNPALIGYSHGGKAQGEPRDK